MGPTEWVVRKQQKSEFADSSVSNGMMGRYTAIMRKAASPYVNWSMLVVNTVYTCTFIFHLKVIEYI